MDKVKTNFVIIITISVIVSLVLIGYAASLNSQLSAEKIKTMQLNDQIAGFKAKVNDLEAQLTTTTAKASDQTSLVTSLQSSLNSLRSSLDTANAESDKLKTAYADLESKLKAEVPVNAPQPAAN
jgi:chromosome segregation ATPase